MATNDIPCIKNKCLKFPICKNKKKIQCNILKNYVDKYWKRETETQKAREVFSSIMEVFNNIEGVYYETPTPYLNLKEMEYILR